MVKRILILAQMCRWTKVHELLTELGIKKDDLSQIVEEASIALRQDGQIYNTQTFYLLGSLQKLLSFRWTKGNELITELKLQQTQIPEIVKDAHIALRYHA